MAAVFDEIVEQAEAKRLLQAALDEGPAHAYLLYGPGGVGKRKAAIAFAGTLLGDRGRVERRAHPDLYVLEPLGDQIRIDEIRALRRDLHMRPFEAGYRVYLVVSAHLLNTEAADALLKDLEEPPEYAVIVLVADDLGPIPETIRSRCQLVPFTRLSERAVRAVVDAWAPGISPERATAVARSRRPLGARSCSASHVRSTPIPASRRRPEPVGCSSSSTWARRQRESSSTRSSSGST